MGSSDIAPPTAPVWLVDVSTACLGLGVFFWLIAYVFMVRRSLATGYTAVPIAALGVNLAWEAVWVAYVTDSRLELVGFAAWLLLDLPVVYSTLRTARRSFMRRSLVGSYPGITLASVFIVSAVVYALFARWWLAVPHRGFGDKTGKTWRGIEYRDTTELSWWTAGFAQALCSVTALTMLLSRGHSGGQGYKIW